MFSTVFSVNVNFDCASVNGNRKKVHKFHPCLITVQLLRL